MFCEETLTLESARAMITSTYPEFRGARVELLDEGWDFSGCHYQFPAMSTSMNRVKAQVGSADCAASWRSRCSRALSRLSRLPWSTSSHRR